MGTSKDTMWVSIELSPASLPAQAQGPEPEIQAPGIRQGLLSFGGGVPLLANSQPAEGCIQLRPRPRPAAELERDPKRCVDTNFIFIILIRVYSV